MVQAEARKNGLRYDSRSGSLEQRDQEIANSAAFRKSLYDYDVEGSAIAYLSKTELKHHRNLEHDHPGDSIIT